MMHALIFEYGFVLLLFSSSSSSFFIIFYYFFNLSNFLKRGCLEVFENLTIPMVDVVSNLTYKVITKIIS